MLASTQLFPTDIVEIIIDVLAADDIQSVKSCALVCHAFLPLCRNHIFSSIRLNDPTSRFRSHTARTFGRLLSTTPGIADHIRNLKYCVDVEDFKNPSLCDSLKRITKLQSFSVWHYSSMRTKFHWNNNPSQPALLRLLHFPTLTRLLLFGIDNIVASDFTPCINLKELEIEHVTAADAQSNDFLSTSSEKPIRLSNFSAGLQSATVTTQLCMTQRPNGTPLIDFTDLTRISVKLQNPDSVEASRELFKQCIQLASVYIHVLEPALTCTGFAEMVAPSLQTLTHLRVDIWIDDDSPNDDPLSGLPSELEELNHKNIIENITIGIFVVTDSTCKRGDEWGRLDKALTRSGWSALNQVTLTIRLARYEADYDELVKALRNLPETQFPILSSSKTVEFIFSVPTTWAETG